jgi:hypothetical protein
MTALCKLESPRLEKGVGIHRQTQTQTKTSGSTIDILNKEGDPV